MNAGFLLKLGQNIRVDIFPPVVHNDLILTGRNGTSSVVDAASRKGGD